MARTVGDYYDNSTWRRTTGGGIKYKLVNSEGEFTNVTGRMTETYLVAYEDLTAFLEEGLPVPTILLGGGADGAGAALKSTNNPHVPGLSGMRVASIRFRGHVDGLPTDPFQQDPLADGDTYNKVLECVVTYENSRVDPKTQLHISCQASGEYLNTTAPGAIFYRKGYGNIANRNPAVPTVVRVPSSIYTVRRESIPRDFFRQALLPSLRDIVGKVNTNTVSQIYNALPDTLLFESYTFEEVFGWRGTGEFAGQPFVNVELKFIEKYLKDNTDGEVITHQHAWNPGVGWNLMFLDANGTIPLYQRENFDNIFGREVDPEDGDDL